MRQKKEALRPPFAYFVEQADADAKRTKPYISAALTKLNHSGFIEAARCRPGQGVRNCPVHESLSTSLCTEFSR
jgi:hypothetical protein